ncbi:hypothetical protein [Staphylococcus ureilyticus]|uniref:hypothetical protein n=1 Tax=Staphylococcus ureilyticus TaxID=94138 RepID=UPI00387B3733
MKKLINFLRKKKSKQNLLVIAQKDINSVPTVIYQGKTIPLKQQINFEWDTKDLDKPYGTAFSVQYTDYAEDGNRQVTECYAHPSKTELLEGVVYTTGLHDIADNEKTESIISINNK